MPIKIIGNLVISPSAECFTATLAALRQMERFSDLANWSHWEHLDFLDTVGHLWVCPLADGSFCGGLSFPHPGSVKHNPRLLIPTEKLSYLIRLKGRCFASAMATVVERTVERIEFMVNMVEEACDANNLNNMISAVKDQVRIWIMNLSWALNQPPFLDWGTTMCSPDRPNGRRTSTTA